MTTKLMHVLCLALLTVGFHCCPTDDGTDDTGNLNLCPPQGTDPHICPVGECWRPATNRCTP